MSEYGEERLTLTDEDGTEIEFIILGRLKLNGTEYAFLEDPEDEGSVMVYRVASEDGEEVFEPVEDEDECEEAFFYFQAEADDYEVGPAE